MNTFDYYVRANEEFDRRMHAVTAEKWTGATPCTDWDVKALVHHVVEENLWVPPLLAGRTIAEVGDRISGDLLGSDPYAAWDASRKEGIEAARGIDLDSVVHVSYGDISADQYLREVATDIVIHTWDLARGVGADDRLADDIIEEAWGFMEPVAEAWRQGGAFGPEVQVPVSAGVQERLLALTGRQP